MPHDNLCILMIHQFTVEYILKYIYEFSLLVHMRALVSSNRYERGEPNQTHFATTENKLNQIQLNQINRIFRRLCVPDIRCSKSIRRDYGLCL